MAAISSPVGRFPRGIVRLTGPDAVSLCTLLFSPEDSQPLDQQTPWRLIPGRLYLESTTSVPCNAVVFLPPRSYTGQPLVELHLAGSPALLGMALQVLTAAGARLAEPGEFTARAFLTGRMDLLAAEAVAERIAARSDAQLAAAGQLAGGTLARQIGGAVDELADLLGLVEAGIDFADEPIEFIDAVSLGRRLADLRAFLQDLLAHSIDMQRLEVLPRVAVVGPMNAGKSSLVNRLSGLDRSICSPIPGTTRDVLSAVMDSPTGQVLLLDGPGLGAPRSDIDRQAQAAWRDLLRHVDLALVVLPADQLYDIRLRRADGTSPGVMPDDAKATFEAVAGRPCVVAANKQDLLSPGAMAALSLPRRSAAEAGAAMESHEGWKPWSSQVACHEPERGVCKPESGTMLDAGPASNAGASGRVHIVSAVTGQGCDDLRAAIGAAVAGISTTGQGCIVLTARHSQALQAGLEAIAAAADLADHAGDSAELIALHLRDAVAQLGQVTGSVTTEDLLERVFSRFCIGK